MLLLGSREVQNYTKPKISPSRSSKDPIVQVADLFAGLAAFSWSKGAEYDKWKMCKLGQLSMFGEGTGPSLSRSQIYKARTLESLESLCSQKGFLIRDPSGGGLRTRDPVNPMNFWLYMPQREEDKAPTR